MKVQITEKLKGFHHRNGRWGYRTQIHGLKTKDMVLFGLLQKGNYYLMKNTKKEREKERKTEILSSCKSGKEPRTPPSPYL